MECSNTSPAIALNNKRSRAGRFFREGEYARSPCSWIFHKRKDEPARTNNNRTKQNLNLRESKRVIPIGSRKTSYTEQVVNTLKHMFNYVANC